MQDNNMMSSHRLIWISTINPEATLDSSTWITTSRELQKIGWDVSLIGKGREGEHIQNDVSIECFSVPDIYLLGQLIFYAKIVRRVLKSWHQTDIVLFHQDMAIAVLTLRILRLFGRKPRFVMDTRDFADVVNGRLKTRIRLRFFKQIYRWNKLFADAQTTITERMAIYASVPKADLLGTWPSGVELEKFEAAHQNRNWLSKDRCIELIYIGSIVTKRNHIELCKAVKKMNDLGKSFRFTLYGNGDARPTIEQYAKEVGHCIQVCDPVPHDQIPQILSKHHVGVTSLPPVDDAKYMASSPIKIFEYMAAGMPILATANPCHVDVVENGRYAFWADSPATDSLVKALHQIWKNRDELAILGQESHQDADNWTWERAAGKLSRALLKSLEQ